MLPVYMQHRRLNSLNEFTMQSRLMTAEEKKIGKRSEWFRVNLTGPIKNFPRNICSLTYITTLVIKNNNLERLPPELGNLVNLINLDASHNRLQALPTTLGSLTEMRALILNDNNIVELPMEIGLLLNLRHFNLLDNPLNPFAASMYADGSEANVRRLVRHYLDGYYKYVNNVPPQRKWRHVSDRTSGCFPFTLMSYNILSPHYATANMYPYCPSWAMDWDYRRRGIIEELKLYNPDIICLQEVDTDQYETLFLVELGKSKYSGIFLPKSRCRTMDQTDAKKVDGCAIFWKNDKFNKVADFQHEFMLSCSNVCTNPSPILLNRVMIRDNVALAIILEIKGGCTGEKSNRQFCVATGHIYWDPEFSDVKLIQTIIWTAELWSHLEKFVSTPSASLAQDSGHSPANRMPVILCGDFNSLPHSGVVEFLSKGSVLRSHAEFLNYGFNYDFEEWKVLERGAIQGDLLRHRFNFDRAYRDSDGMSTTNLTYDFKGMIDYIFFTRQHFRLLGSLDQVPDSWFSQVKIAGCPHVHLPSDHFSLLVELDLLPPVEVSQPGTVSPKQALKSGRPVPSTASSGSRQKKR